jgi:NAD(P)-dependent dehydrogenase (short-subunit alcohol dehydrogenase family)
MGKTAKLFDLTGKSVIVTGSGRGLGRAMARGLAEAGARVTICGRSADIVGETAEELRADGHEALDVEFDARDRADVQRLIDTTVAAFGGLDIMVVNHGIGRAKRAENITPDGWNEMIGINLTSAFTCAQLAGQYMIERGRGGSIVLTGSTGSLVAFEGLRATARPRPGSTTPPVTSLPNGAATTSASTLSRRAT